MSADGKRVLFVCLGNICRSPAAEGVFEHVLEARGLDDAVEVDSAGTSAYHIGDRADPRMRAAAERRGYDLKSRARRLEGEDFDRFDLIVAMDRDNLREIRSRAPADVANRLDGQVRLLGDFLPDGWPDEVPDPYYGGPQGFERVLDMLEAACPALIAELVPDAGSED